MFRRFLTKVKRIRTDEIVRGAVGGVTDQIEQMNVKQLESGKRKDNSAIRPRYKSVKYKGRLTPVDLKLTGDFHRSISAEATQREIVVGSDRMEGGFDLASHLESTYSGGSSIYGINNKKLINLLKPGIVKELRNELQK